MNASTLTAVNPANEQAVGEWTPLDHAGAAGRLQQAAGAFATWSRLPFPEREEPMRRLAERLRRDEGRLSRLITTEMGKPIAQAESEIGKCAWVCTCYADQAERLLAARPVGTDATRSYLRFDPLGPILAIMPWNFPFWQVFRFAAPALMAGNVALLKHAENVPGCAEAIEELFRSAGFPEGVLTNLPVATGQVPDIIRDPALAGITLTGSTRAGSEVAAVAGSALKKTVLELGGSDSFLVLEDADPKAAATTAVRSRTINSGQSCIAAKRFIVTGAVEDAFVEAMKADMSALRTGDPMDRSNHVGPLARRDLLETLHDQVQRSVAEGAELLLGGRPLDRRGFFYEPTLLDRVHAGMAVFDEETFGPVAAVVRARDRDHAVELANASTYGLAATVFTGDPRAGEALAARLAVGSVFVNDMARSDARLPFGGVKRSGYGRELGSAGIREFINIKTVVVA